MSGRILATNAFWSLLSHLLWRGSLILGAMILARTLSTSDFAAYSYYQLTVSMFAAYAALGLGVTASRFFAEVGHERPDSKPPPLGTLLSLSLLMSTTAFLLVLCIPGDLLNAGLDVPRWLLASGVAALALGIVPGGAILGLERYRQAAMISAVSGLIMIVGVLYAATKHAPVVAMAAIVVNAFVQTSGQFLIVLKVVGWKRLSVGLLPSRDDVRKVLGFAGPMLMVSLLAASGSWIVGRIILHEAHGKVAFSLYTIGLQWYSLALLIPGMISRVVLPRLVRVSAGSAPGASRRIVRLGAMLSTVIAALMAFVGAIAGPWLMKIYGDNYEVSRWFIGAFMGAAIFSASANTVGNAIVAKDGQRSWLAFTVVWLAVLLIVAVTTKVIGAWAGALSQAIAAMVLVCLALNYAKRRELL